MILYNKGFCFDLEGDIKNAILYYTLSIENGEEVDKCYSNLIAILIEISFDYGVSSFLIANKVFTESEIRKMYSVLEGILERSLLIFKLTNEFEFWKYYKDNYFKDFERNGLISIIEKCPDNLTPYFYLYINDLSNNIQSNRYINKIYQLKKSIEKELTFKNNYIKSFIESSEQNLC